MTVSGNGNFKVGIGYGLLYVDDGVVTVTGDDGGFNTTFSEYFFNPGDPYPAFPPVRIGYDTFGPASLTLVGGGDGVDINVEDAGAPRFAATVQVGVGGQTGANDADGTLNITQSARLTSRNNGLYDPGLGFVDGGSYNINIGRRGTGEVNVFGEGSFLGAYGTFPRITVGREDGDGALNIRQGGDVGTGGLEVGRQDGGVGLVTVDGAGSTLTVSNDYGLSGSFNGTDFSGYGPSVQVGRDGGDGAIEVTNGGTFTITNLDGVTDNVGLQLGRGVESTGRLKVQGAGSTASITQVGPSDDAPNGAFFSIGRGGQATADIYDGGVVNVTGNDAFVEVGGDHTDGSVSGLTSYLNISSGGVLNIDSEIYEGGGLNIAQNAGTSGVVTVEGEGSQINITSDGDGSGYGAFLQVGRRGDGQLFVQDGADIVIDGGGDQLPVFFVGVADADGSAYGTGYAKISGAGSTVTVTDDNAEVGPFIAVGRRAGSDGYLIVEDGGVLSALSPDAGMEVAGGAPGDTGFLGSSGVVQVLGAGSRIEIRDIISIGGDIVNLEGDLDATIGGDGVVDVLDGAQLISQSIFVGEFGQLAVQDAVIQGDVTSFGTFFAGGRFEVGDGTLIGDLISDSGDLAVDVTGFDAGETDTLLVDGDVSLSESLITLDLINLFRDQIAAGDEFQFLTATGAITLAEDGEVGQIDPLFAADFDIEKRMTAGGEALFLVVESVAPNAAPDAVNDAARTGEGASVAGDLFANDDATDELAFTLASVEGSAGNIGATITLASGAEVTVTADGSFVYDPNGAFDDLLSGETATDSFVYTIEDGLGAADTATATVTIDGAGAPPPPPSDETAEPTAGDDDIVGDDENDNINAGAGDDSVEGGGGNDKLKGGKGDDVLKGQAGNDVLVGGGGADKLVGGGGKDKLKGGGGKDTLKGGGGKDDLKGGGGDDKLVGGGGKDKLQGQKGDDLLIGGGGADTMVFKAADGDDTIKRFQNGTDLIDIKSGAGGFGALDITQDGANAVISFAKTTITLQKFNANKLDAGDFLFKGKASASVKSDDDTLDAGLDIGLDAGWWL